MALECFVKNPSMLSRLKNDYVYTSWSTNTARTKCSPGNVPSRSDLSTMLFYFLAKCPYPAVDMS